MEPDPLAPSVIQEPVQSMVYYRRPQRQVLLLWGGEQPPGLYLDPVFPHYLQHGWRKNQGTDRRFRFRFIDHQLRIYYVHLFVDPQFPSRQIQVIPLETHQLPQPETCREFQKKQFIVVFFFRLDQQSLHGFPGEDLHLHLFQSADGDHPSAQLKTVPREQALAEACPAPDWNYLRWEGYSDRKYQAIGSGEGLLELEWDGKKVPLELQVRAYYCGGALALMLADWTSGEPEPWADLTVNLGGPDKKDCAFVDVNKLGQDILPWIEQNGLGQPTGRSQRSGFVVYPEYRFDSERLKELDDEGYKVYVQLLEKRREVKKARGRER